MENTIIDKMKKVNWYEEFEKILKNNNIKTQYTKQIFPSNYEGQLKRMWASVKTVFNYLETGKYEIYDVAMWKRIKEINPYWDSTRMIIQDIISCILKEYVRFNKTTFQIEYYTPTRKFL